MSNPSVITVNGVDGIFVALVHSAGKIDPMAMAAQCLQDATAVAIREAQDFGVIASEVNSYLLENPSIKTIPLPELRRSLWERRVESGLLKKEVDILDSDGKPTGQKKTVSLSREEKNDLATRLEDTLTSYLRAQPDQFFIGKKVGVAIHYVMDGNTKAFRFNNEDWTRITGKSGEMTTPSMPPASGKNPASSGRASTDSTKGGVAA